MAVFIGFYALGTGVNNLGVFQEATTYTRPAVTLTGSGVAGLTQSVSQITGPTGPANGILQYGAIFDALTGGNLIAYWPWNASPTTGAYIAVPANFPATAVNIVLNTYLGAALSLSSTGGQGSSGSLIPQGAQIGTVNGQPMIAGTILVISAGNLGANTTLTTNFVYNANSAAIATTLTAANIAGARDWVVLALTGAISGAVNGQLPTVASLIPALLPTPVVGTSYILRILSATATNVWTVTTNTGWTLNGTMAVPAPGWRDFVVTITSITAATATLQTIGSSGSV